MLIPTCSNLRYPPTRNPATDHPPTKSDDPSTVFPTTLRCYLGRPSPNCVSFEKCLRTNMNASRHFFQRYNLAACRVSSQQQYRLRSHQPQQQTLAQCRVESIQPTPTNSSTMNPTQNLLAHAWARELARALPWDWRTCGGRNHTDTAIAYSIPLDGGTILGDHALIACLWRNVCGTCRA